MLDTNIISDLIRNPRGKAARRIATVGEDSVCTSIIVASELRYGCAKSGSTKLRRAIEEILSELEVLPFDHPSDLQYGRVRAEVEKSGRLIGGNDLFIAAHASAHGLTLVTANTDEFRRVQGLKVENWLT